MSTDSDRPDLLEGTDWVVVERELIEPCRDSPIFPSVGYLYVEVYGDWANMKTARDYERYRDGFIEMLQDVAESMPERDEFFPPDGAVRFYLSKPLGESGFLTREHIFSKTAEWGVETDVEFVEELPIDEEEDEWFYKEVVDVP